MAPKFIMMFAEWFTESCHGWIKTASTDYSHKHQVFAALVTPIITEALIKEGRNHPQGTKKQ